MKAHFFRLTPHRKSDDSFDNCVNQLSLLFKKEGHYIDCGGTYLRFDNYLRGSDYVLIPLKKKMQALHTEKSIIESKLQERTTFDDDIEKLIWRVNALFSHPILLWRKAPLKDRRTMLNLLFPQKLRYARLQGFRKAENPLIYAAHSGFSDEESGLAHPKGFEPLAF